jgi:hypothetical protein
MSKSTEVSPPLRSLIPTGLCVLALWAGCPASAGAPPPDPAGVASAVPPAAGAARYADPRMWACRPDRASDACRSPDLTATEVRADGTRAVVPHRPARDPSADCFYVYPTVDTRLIAAGNSDRFDHRIDAVVVQQAARFTEVCRVYAPLYRQVTLGTYLRGEARREQHLRIAFADVADAFSHYLAHHNAGRPLVLIGHSQGADMVVRLLRRFFDDDPSLRQRLLVAMPIGWHVEVMSGQRRGVTFRNLETCQRDEQRGCVIAFRTHATPAVGSAPVSGRHPAGPGAEAVCTNPADLAGNQRRHLRGVYFPVTDLTRRHARGTLDGITTPWAVYRDLYAAQCAVGKGGYRYLGIGAAPAPGDRRRSPLRLDSVWLNGAMGLHILDVHLTLGDLLAQVAARLPSR